MRRVRVALGLCLMQAWGECAGVRRFLDLTKSMWAARAAGVVIGVGAWGQVCIWGSQVGVVGAELYL